MKNSWIRIGIVCGVVAILAVIVVSASSVLPKNLIKKDTTQCAKWLKKNACTTTCEDSVYVSGTCRDDITGETSGITFECCCCTDGADHRSFIGG